MSGVSDSSWKSGELNQMPILHGSKHVANIYNPIGSSYKVPQRLQQEVTQMSILHRSKHVANINNPIESPYKVKTCCEHWTPQRVQQSIDKRKFEIVFFYFKFEIGRSWQKWHEKSSSVHATIFTTHPQSLLGNIMPRQLKCHDSLEILAAEFNVLDMCCKT